VVLLRLTSRLAGAKAPPFSRKATAKMNWNISANHRFNIKYFYLKSYCDVTPSNSGAIGPSNIGRAQSQFGLPHYSSYYSLNSLVAELNSTPNVTNPLTFVGYDA
jgi:hypothetical protein